MCKNYFFAAGKGREGQSVRRHPGCRKRTCEGAADIPERWEGGLAAAGRRAGVASARQAEMRAETGGGWGQFRTFASPVNLTFRQG